MKVGDKVRLRKITEKEYRNFGIDVNADRLGNQIVTIQYMCDTDLTFKENSRWCYRIEWATPILNVLAKEGEY